MRRALALASVALLLAGCGVLDEEGPAISKAPDPAVYGPAKAVAREQPATEAPKLAKPSASVAAALDDGAVGVVDLTGTVTIEPRTLETASDQTLEDVQWTRWGADGAQGTGRLRMLTCQPTCASGGSETIEAAISLTGVKTCDGRRYYEHARLDVDPKDTPSGSQPATYVRAPC